MIEAPPTCVSAPPLSRKGAGLEAGVENTCGQIYKMASERERVAKLESRSKEAENALQQLNGYVELLKKKSG